MQYLEICRGFSYLLGVIECEKTAVSSFNSGLFYRNFHEKKNSHAFSSIPFFPLFLQEASKEEYKFSFLPFFFFSPTVQNALKGTNVVGK